MEIGLSLFLIALGAILAWAVNGTVTGIDIHVVGAILMVVGVIGLVLSMVFWSSFAPFADRAPFRRRVPRSVAPTPDTVVVRERISTIEEAPRRDDIEPR